MKHTPEPWVYYDDGIGGSDIILGNVADENYDLLRAPEQDDSESRPWEESRANVERAVACVNACAGIEDPGKVIPLLISTLENLYEHEGEVEVNGIGIESDSDALEEAKKAARDLIKKVRLFSK